MSQFPPPEHDPYMAPSSPIAKGATEGNGMAVASLVCGVLFCIPVITGLLAILFGILGIRKASSGRAGGKGMAIAGLLLGIVGLGGQAIGGFFLVQFGKIGMQVVTLPEEFLKDLSSGNVNSALGKS